MYCDTFQDSVGAVLMERIPEPESSITDISVKIYHAFKMVIQGYHR